MNAVERIRKWFTDDTASSVGSLSPFVWGEGWGEGVTDHRETITPLPTGPRGRYIHKRIAEEQAKLERLELQAKFQ
jgi:hypothetical protein